MSESPGPAAANAAPAAAEQVAGGPRRVVIVGAGGVIGSHLVPHLGRMPLLERVTLIDPDVYERKNLESQDIVESDVDRSKVDVQARRLRRIAPSLAVDPISAAVETLPLGLLRGAVILACLDSRKSRQVVNAAARHLGVPWIDAGVSVAGGGDLLARVTIYLPGADQPCLECAWDERDYEILEQEYPCTAEAGARRAGAHSTRSPSGLGALAAALQAIECQRLMSGRNERAGCQILLDAEHQTHYLTRFERQPRCRLAEHDEWLIQTVGAGPQDLNLEQVFALGSRHRRDDGAPSTLRVEGRSFERKATCTGCGRTERRLRLLNPDRPEGKRCRHCGERMVAAGFHQVESLARADLSRRDLDRSLRSLGVRAGDILRIERPDGIQHFEVAGRAQESLDESPGAP